MKLVTLMSLVLALSSAAAVAAPKQDPCDRPVLAAARSWQKKEKMKYFGATVMDYDKDDKGNTIALVQMPLGEDGDCWTNLIVTVEEKGKDQCEAVKVEEDTSAESCS